MDKPEDTGINEIKEHQAHHCVELLHVRSDVAVLSDAISVLSTVLLGKQLITVDDIKRIAAAVTKERADNAEEEIFN